MSEASRPVWRSLPNDRQQAALLTLAQIALRRGRPQALSGEADHVEQECAVAGAREIVGQDLASASGAIGDGVHPPIDAAAG